MNIFLLRHHRRSLRRGVALIEVILSTMLISVVLLGAMDLLGAVTRGRVSTAESIRGQLLAQQLMTEILSKAYKDTDLLAILGLDLGELLGNRGSYDDVDDYHGYSESPLASRTGATLANTTGWRRTVTVEYVTPGNPANTTASDAGVKRVTVQVLYNGRTVSKLVALRSNKS